MKRIYILVLILLLAYVSNSLYAQITIVDAVAVDGDSNGQYGTVEIQFSVGVDDSDIKDPGDRDDWEFSLDPEFSSYLTPSAFSTEVSYIATDADVDDEYIQFTFSTEFASSDGPIYFRYTQEGDKIWDSATGNTDSLPNFSLKSARDISPPYINSVTSVQVTTTDTLIVGDKIVFTVDLKDPVPNGDLTILPLQYNGSNLNWYTDDGGATYKGTYTVEEGHTNQKLPLQLTGVTAEDSYGNVSTSVDGSDVTKGIDANTPTIKTGGVTSNATIVDTLIVGQTIIFTVDIDDAAPDPTLTILPLEYNGEDLNWSTSDAGDTYQGTYTIVEGNQDQFTPLQLTGVTATDPSGNVSNTVNGTDVVASIDANTPVINSVISDATASGVLKVGDKITFTVDIDVKDGNLVISPSQYNGEDLNWYTSDGGSTYKGIYTVTEGDTDQGSPLDLTGVTATDLAGNVSSSVDGSDVAKTIDANTPVINSVTSDATTVDTLIVGQTITFTVDIAVTETGLTILPLQYNGRNLNWTAVSGGDTYEGTYTVTEGDLDITTPLQLTGVTANDAAGNVSTSVSGGDVVVKTDANTPIINSVTSDATVSGVLKVGDKITFTVDIDVKDGNLVISPSQYNGEDLNWYTSDGGSTYKGIYTVTEGDTDQGSSLDLTGVTASDLAGNVSSSVDGSDVVKTIDANTPVINSVTSDATTVDTLIVGQTITFTVDVAVTETGLTILPLQYNGRNLNWTAVSGGDTYEGTYTVTEGDLDITTPLQLTGVTASDAAGNVSTSVSGSDVVVRTDANTPVINSVTSDATASGVLKVGDKITFTVDIDVKDGNLVISPSQYNGVDLNWYTSDGGSTYKGIYTVTEGDTDQGSPLDLTGVTATDLAGNVSSSADGSDVAKTIDANSPVITDVLVNPVTMIYGQDYTITVTVNSDGDSYSLVSGTLAGFNLHSLAKDANDTYFLDFTVGSLGYDILEGDSYDVLNLVLSDPAGNLSNVYSETITQLSDPIYTVLPTAKVKGNQYVCAGDSAELTFQLTGNAPWEVDLYDGSSTTTISSIDDSPYIYKVKTSDLNISINPDTVVYKITRVTDTNGNSKIMSGTDSSIVFINELPDVYFTDPAGNQTYNINNEDPDTLSGNPVGGIFTGDGIVSSNSTFLTSSAGLGVHEIVYTYTIASTGCSDSDTLEFEVVDSDANITFENDDAWRCDYESTFGVSAEVISNPSIIGDLYLYAVPSAITSTGNNTAEIDVQQLSEGSYEVTFEYIDNATLFSVTKSFTVESVSSSIDFTDLDDVCEDYDSIFVNAVNLSPSGGTGEYIFSGAGGAFEYDPSNPNNNSGYFLPGTISSGAYDLKYVYTTPNGCESDTVKKSFNVNELPHVEFTMAAVYNIDQGESTITGNQPGGEFTPLRFMSNIGGGEATFDPQDAGLGTWWVKYTYEDANGCINSDSTEIEVNQALGDIASKIGSFQYCYFGTEIDTLVGTPNPTDGTPGNFYIDDLLITPYASNTILFNPQDYTAGEHTVKFEYYNGATAYYVYKTVDIDSIGDISFTGLDQQYCEDEDIEVELTASYPDDIGTVKFSGNGITDDVNDKLGYFNPIDANLGDNIITYNFTRDYSGCQKDFTRITTVYKTPTVALYPNERCITGTDDLLGFTADTIASDSVVNWEWKFRSVYTSNDEAPQFPPTIGSNRMILTLETNKGCTNFADSTFYIGTKVDLEFTFENECYGETVLFELLTSSDDIDEDSVRWNFGGSGSADLSDTDNPTYVYASPGAYDVIYEEFTKSCGRIADTVTINVRPSIDLSVDNYMEDFEDDPGTTGWVIEDFGTSASGNSWQWGEPAGEKINSAPSGQNAFVTNLSGSYGFDEAGMVTSPCFDFSGMKRPMMKMDFVSYSEKDRDGAVIQYTKANGDWATIGVPNDGVNWYNSYIISGAPANQQLGWTGEITGDENDGWQTAMYRLDELRGRAGVRFRVVFGSDAAGTGYEGFAFDNIQFSERKRTVLLENFTNIADNNALEILEDINDEIEKDSLDVVSLNYHTSFPNANDLNAFYPSGPGARALYYGISGVPYSIVDGVSKFSYLSGQDLSESDIHMRMLVDPSFDISLKQDIQGSNLMVSSGVKALEDLNDYKLTVYVAVVEKTVDQESNTYYNVLRTMLPDAAGTLIEQEWFADDSVKIYQTWAIPEGVNSDDLMTIVFVQDNDTKEVYQTEYTDDFSNITSDNNIINRDLAEYSVYPNPSKGNLTIQMSSVLSKDISVNIYDGVGKLVKADILLQGESLLQTDIKELPAGVYYLKLNTQNGDVFQVSKIIKTE